MAKFQLMSLPYGKDALGSFLSTETLEYHYGKHHSNYVNKLNELLPGSGFEQNSLEEIVKKSTGSLFNNAAQVFNHDFYWNNLKAKSEGRMGPRMESVVRHSFQSFDHFKSEFEKAAINLFGSGWVWLAIEARSQKLSILPTKDADNPIRHSLQPLLTLDVWEHAYYIDYRNARAKYVHGWWNHVNWEFAENELSKDLGLMNPKGLQVG